VGHLGRPIPEHVTQHEHGALARREALEAGDEGQADRLSGLVTVAPTRLGQASGTFNTLRQLGGVFGIAVLAAVFSGAGGYASPQLFSDGFSAALGTSALLSALGAVAALGLPVAVGQVAKASAAQVATVSAPSCSEIATSIE
jgi:hypothetical protein